MGTATKISRPLRAAVALVLPVVVLFVVLSAPSLAGEPAPLVQDGAKLTAAEESGEGRFGHGVALSGDGDTVLIGAPGDSGNAGAAWVFTPSDETWASQGKLAALGELGEGRLGDSVALSADGDTALVGAPNDSSGNGAVWVYERTGSTWIQQAELTGAEAGGDAWFGRSVALSADGNTALVGGFVDRNDTGAAWVFTRSGSTWAQQGPKLTGGEENGTGEFGWSVALSAEGNTALVGARRDSEGVGAAWVFARSGSTWAQQGPKLTGGEENGAGGFGWSVALSAEGNTALVGGQRDDELVGAAWVFARAGSTWIQQGAKLTGSGEEGAGMFGHSVALSSTGDSALIGAPRDKQNRGAVWLFTRSGSTWTQQGAKLAAEDEHGKGELGWSVALSEDGASALIGGIADDEKAGAAWLFGPAPQQTPPPSATSPPPATSPLVPVTGAPTASASPNGGSTPRQGVAGFKVTNAAVELLGRRLLVRDGRTGVKLHCAAATTCRGHLVLTLEVRAKSARRARLATVARAAFSILHGRTATVALKLGALTRKGLRADRTLSAMLAIDVLAPDSPPSVQKNYVVKLIPRHARRNQG